MLLVMSDYETFELRRQNDDLIYTFDRAEKNNERAYKRRDADLWIILKKGFGWCAWDEEEGLMGRCWEVLPSQQSDFPPEGVWVSRKNEKSYVYELVYI